MISFIIPNRGGTQIEYIVFQLKKFYPNDEYIVISQEDEKPFMRGQLFNIGYYYAKGKYLCFIDNDMFFPEYIDLVKLYEEGHYGVLQPFENIAQVKIKENGEYETTSVSTVNYKCGGAMGGSSFISVENFREMNGFSNLYIGWGREDNEFYHRAIEHDLKFDNIPTTINHITHPKRTTEFVENFLKSSEYILDTDKDKNCTRDHSKDSYRDTKFEVVYDKTDNGIRYIGVSEIYAHPTFGYPELLKEQHDIYLETLKKQEA